MHSCLAPAQVQKGIKCTDPKCKDPECKGAIYTSLTSFEAHVGMAIKQNAAQFTRILNEPDNTPGLSLK
jgi:hypothetical protein